MRRILVIVLLAFLPVQFSWSAVASYCEHETRAGAGHIGHHEHEHQHQVDVTGLDAADDATGDKTPGAVDLDCGQCHGHGTGMLTLLGGLLGAVATARPDAPPGNIGAAVTPTRPERPQWLPLV